MSALVGAMARLTLGDEVVEGAIVAVAAAPNTATYPLPNEWHCLLLVDGDEGRGKLVVVGGTQLEILSAPGLHAVLRTEPADEAIGKLEKTCRDRQLKIEQLESEAATLAAEVARLKKAAAKKP